MPTAEINSLLINVSLLSVNILWHVFTVRNVESNEKNQIYKKAMNKVIYIFLKMSHSEQCVSFCGVFQFQFLLLT